MDTDKYPCFPVRFVTVICWDASFRENVDAVRSALDQTLPEDGYEVIFVDYYAEVSEQVRGWAGEHANLQTVALGNVHSGKGNDYVFGACINEGLRRARGDLIVVPDGDVMFEQNFLEEVVRRHERNDELVMYFYRVDEPETDDPVPRTIEDVRRVGRIEFPRNFGGCLSVRKKWLEAINGYEQGPLWRGYCSVGNDVAVRLKALGLSVKWHPDKFVYHGYHPGCAAPDADSLERIYLQNMIIRGREKALETLPENGLEAGRTPRWRADEVMRLASTGARAVAFKQALRRIVRRLVPRGLRRKIVGLLWD